MPPSGSAPRKSMASLPSGTVTFLFTDIEGSTTRWEHQPEAMRVALARHDMLVRAAIVEHHGHVVKTMGDAFHAAFSRAPDAVAAALDAQRRLQAEPWGVAGPVRVRMALHTGAAEERDGDYYGPTLNRAARLMSAGHGGQVLLSQATSELIRDGPPEGTSLRDLGEYRLKDLSRPEHVFQLISPDLPTEFPPLRSLDSLPNNLPRYLTSFVGREREIAEVGRLLAATSLLTLVGTGGAGKTRLALQVAAGLLETYPDGVWLVELAALADPSLVQQAVASALGLREATGRPPIAVLSDHLQHRQVLLVLDNCEHLVLACADLVDALLRACPELRVMATSREALGIAGETTWRVPSLLLPDPRHTPTADSLMAYAAVRLFIDRAVAASSGFAVTNENAPSIAQICQRLDGIPLAIELAAVRVKVLSAEQIAARLDDRFRLLTAGSRTALPRQQTLRALIDWSYDLLSEKERTLLGRLSVFAGGWDLDATEHVGTSDDLDAYDVLDLLAQLVDKSLVLADERAGAARYRLLETIRQYGAERLRAAGEEAVLRRRHRDWVLDLVIQQTARLGGAEQADALARLELEHDNIRSALDWCETEPGGVEVGAQIADELGWFWELRGHIREGSERSARLLTLAQSRTGGRAHALSVAGMFDNSVGAYEQGAARFEESITIWRELRDIRGAAIALARFGQLEQSRARFDHAWVLLKDSQQLFQQIGGESGLGTTLSVFLAQVAKNRGDYEQAIPLFEECLADARERGDKHSVGSTLRSLGELVQLRGDYVGAATRLHESLRLIHELDDQQCTSTTFDCLGTLALAQGEHIRAVRLWAAAEASRESQGLVLSEAERERLDQIIADGRSRLGDDAFAAAWSDGSEMSAEQAVAYALEEPVAP
jgi:predicted ATPase/class 3 adenylate cyclase